MERAHLVERTHWPSLASGKGPLKLTGWPENVPMKTVHDLEDLQRLRVQLAVQNGTLRFYNERNSAQ